MITSYPPELSAGASKRDVRQALPAEGQLWPCDDDDGDDDDDDASSEEPHNPKDKEGLVQCH